MTSGVRSLAGADVTAARHKTVVTTRHGDTEENKVKGKIERTEVAEYSER